ncbi:MAG: T9SS type A sorting domain-containing protein [Flavobacteriia bacterium]
MKNLKTLLFFVFFSHVTFASNLFWIGGSGDFNDQSKWSYTSGGVSCNCIPTSADNVIFDANSFQNLNETITISTSVNCKNMDWSLVTNNPTLAGTYEFELHIYGNLKFSSSMNISFEGTSFFESNVLGTLITMNNQEFKGTVVFNNPNGEWILQDNFFTTRGINLIAGTFNSNNKTVQCNNFYSTGSNIRGLVLGNSLFLVTGDDRHCYNCYGEVWNLDPINFNLFGGNSIIRFTNPMPIYGMTVKAGNNLNYATIDLTPVNAGARIYGNNNYLSILAKYHLQLDGNNTIGFLKAYSSASIAGNNIIRKAALGESPYTGDFTINGNNNIDTLQLKAGRKYNLDNTNTLIVNRLLQSNGTCSEPITLIASNPSSEIPANIQMPIGAVVQLNYTILKHINANGGANFNANNSSDVYNNTGINFITPVSKTMYWVGGTGNWNDVNHWSQTSGGIGGYCVPTKYDNVFFDINSFNDSNQVVSILAERSAYCKNFTCSNANLKPIISILSELDINGSISLNQKLRIEGTNIKFESLSLGNSILTNSCTVSVDFIFNGVGGEWTFLDNFNSTKAIWLNKGSLKMNNRIITCDLFNSTTTYQRTLDVSNAQINLTHNICYYCDNNVWNIAGQNLIFTNGNSSTINCTGIGLSGWAFGFQGGGQVYNNVNSIDTTSIFNIVNDGVFNNIHFYGNGNLYGTNTISSLISENNCNIYTNNTISNLEVKKDVVFDGNNLIHDALLFGNGMYTGENVFDTLTLGKGSVHSFSPYYNQTINKLFNSLGTCTEPITLKSNTNTSQQATLTIPATAVVNVDFSIFKDIKVIGGVNFIAQNSSDIVNNSGITFLTPTTKTMYWVSGVGNWNDPNHWSANSGGAGGYCIPTQNDNVIFDVNSFTDSNQVVTVLDLYPAYCLNFTCTNSNLKHIINIQSSLNIYASANLSSHLSFTGNAINFESQTTNKSITSNSAIIGVPVNFNGDNGEWTIVDDFYCTSVVTQNKGKLNIINKDFTCDIFSSFSGYNRQLDISNSNLYLIHNGCYYCNNDFWHLDSTNLLFIGGQTSNIYSTGKSYDWSVNQFIGGNLSYNNIFITDTNSFVLINNNGTFNDIIFNDKGNIIGNNTINSVEVDSDTEINGANSIQKITVGNNSNFIGSNSLHHATLNGNGNFTGANAFDTLIFNLNKIYTFGLNETQKINQHLSSIGSCTEPITIKGNDNVLNFATIEMPITATISVDNTMFKNIHVVGGISFSASNSTDISNNSGINFSLPTTKTMYWVGGIGNWNDANHWSSTSGGSAGYCIPTKHDNVVFDINSFTDSLQNVTILGLYPAYCNNFTCNNSTKKPNINIQSSLNIYGSMSLSSKLTFSGSPIFFEALTTGKTITGNGANVGVEMYFNGKSGAWTFMDNFVSSNRISHNDGTLNLNNRTITCKNFYSISDSSRSLNITNTKFYLSHNGCYQYCDNGVWRINNTNITLIGSNTASIYSTGQSVSWAPTEIYGSNYSYKSMVSTDTNSFLIIYSNSTIANIEFKGIGNINGNNIVGKLKFNRDGNIYGNNTFDTLVFTTSKNYTFGDGNTTAINDLWQNIGDCNYFTNTSSSSGSTSFISVVNTQNIAYNNLSNLEVVGGTVIATNCNDINGNNGFTLSAPSPRNLYWVNGSGNWSETQHWSLTSGGIGGECIPSSNDNVFFDANSFPIYGTTVNINETAFCKNMDWTGALREPLISGTKDLYVFGYMKLIPQMQFNFNQTIFFKSKTLGTSITTANISLANNIVFNDGNYGGEWILLDELRTTGNIAYHGGTLKTNNQNVFCNSFSPENNNYNKTLDLGNSEFTITGDNANWNLNIPFMNLLPGNSSIKFSGLGNIYFSSLNLNYNKVIFQNTVSTGHVGGKNNFNKVLFYGHGNISSGGNNISNLSFFSNGSIYGSNYFDTLLLSEERNYTLSQFDTSFVNTFLARGIAGLPITINSTNPGDSAYISVPSGIICSNYLNLRDINAIGGATFNAGENSIDNGNNDGWNFISCFMATPIVHQISCFGSNNGQISLHVEGGQLPYSISWSNGANTADISNLPAGTYTYTISDGASNSISGSIEIIEPPLFVATIQALGNTTFCHGSSVTLTANSASSYTWNNGLNSQEVLIQNSGSYSAFLTDANGCQATSNTIDITVNPLPSNSIQTSGNLTFCVGDSVILNADPGFMYLWNNGETTQSINIYQSGNYSVQITDINQCTSTSDEQIVLANNLPFVEITNSGADTICNGSSIALYATGANSYLWNDGSTNQDLWVSASGIYYVEITDGNGCKSRSENDTITVIAPIVSISTSGSTTFCEGSSVTLSASPSNSYLWSDGSTNQDLNVISSGSYFVQITDANGCTATSATETVVVNPLPIASISASGSTTFCEGSSVTLSASPANSYLWSDGSTNQDLNVISSGSYFVQITDANGCSATSSTETVVVNPLPIASISTSGSTTFCEGSSVTLSASPANSYLWSDGSTNQDLNVISSGSYFVQITDGNGCSAISSTETVVVNPLPIASISTSGSATFCEGASVTLSASPANSYLWSDGSTNQDLNVISSGSYFVQITDANGCSATSASETVVVNLLPISYISTSGGTTFCEGSSVTLSASPANSYLWSDGSTNQDLSVMISGSYFVQITDGNGCSATSSTETVVVNPLPQVILNDFANICDTMSLLELNSGTPAGGIYSGQGVNNNFFDPSVGAGIFDITYTFTDINGCTNEDMGSIEVLNCSENGISNINTLKSINVYPNPTSGTIFIEQKNCQNQLLIIYDFTGKKVETIILKNEIESIDLSFYSDGIYYLEIENQKIKIIKN